MVVKKEGSAMDIQAGLERRLDRTRNWESSNVEEVWGEFKKSVMERAVEVCRLQQCRNAQKELNGGMRR